MTPYPYGQAPSQRFRFEQYLNVLLDNNIDYEIYPFMDKKMWLVLYKDGFVLQKILGIMLGFRRRINTITKIRKAEFIFIHRETTPLGPPLFEILIAKLWRKKIIYDFDDSIWLKDPNESSFISKIKWKSKVKYICKWSYKISAGNKYLSQYASKYNASVVLNPTTIDTVSCHNPELYESERNKDSVVIGWTGTHSTLPYLDGILPVLKRLESDYSITFLVIANRKPAFDLNSFEFKEWSKQTEIEDLMKIDIGLMPLSDDVWSLGKCGFKALQFMSLKIPVCVSPVGVNNEIINDSVNGFLCKSSEEWYQKIEKLIQQPEMRLKFGEQGRYTVKSRFSVESNKKNFIGLFDEA